MPVGNHACISGAFKTVDVFYFRQKTHGGKQSDTGNYQQQAANDLARNLNHVISLTIVPPIRTGDMSSGADACGTQIALKSPERKERAVSGYPLVVFL